MSDNFNNDEDMHFSPVKDQSNNSGESFNLKAELFEWAQNIAIILTVIVLFFVFVIHIIGVDGDSMKPTLHNNDWMVISDLFYTPHHGDIVVLTKKSFMEQPIVKRVIATEGQVVDINFQTGQVYVNGIKLDEPYTNEPTNRQFDVNFPVRVPTGCVFVMGDNRNHSSDSRVAAVGMVDRRLILGKLLFRIYPFNNFGIVKQNYPLGATK